jgi:hypothetical protein
MGEPATQPQEPLSRRAAFLSGAGGVAIGLYFMLAAFGLVPAGELNGPIWIGVAAGLTFLLGGTAVILQTAGGANERTGELPSDAPRWMRAAQLLLVLAIALCFALIGSWIAIGPGTRHFTGTLPIGVIGGRLAFGLGAVIVWLFVVLVAKRLMRELSGRGQA